MFSWVWLMIFAMDVTAGGAVTEIYREASQALAQPVRIPLPEALGRQLEQCGTLEICLEATCPGNGWTVYSPNDICLKCGTAVIPVVPKNGERPAHCGRLASGDVLVLAFRWKDRSAEPSGDMPWTLVLGSGIYSWEAPRGPFALVAYVGEKLNVRGECDAWNRLYRVEVSPVREGVAYRWELPDGTRRETSVPLLRGRCPRLPAGSVLKVRVTAVRRDGSTLAADVSIPVSVPPVSAPAERGETLVGLCFYPKQKDLTDTLEPDVSFCVDRLVEERLGNLAVFWPNTADAGPMETMVEKLARKGVYSMTIYQRFSRAQVARLTELGQNRYFLNNNLGEFASYLYQDAAAARACGVLQCGDLLECRDWFVDQYMRRGVRGYQESYPYVFSTCGATVADYEMAGGVGFLWGELFAIGAQNLAFSSAEMRGAARKWIGDTPRTRAFWGGWLAHEWQTGEIPYASPLKGLSLKAALYQQYLMGSGAMILESGSQSTQAAAYTAKSGKKNEGYHASPVEAYRNQMRDFYRFVQQSPPRLGTPQTPIAIARGNGDAYVGLYLENLPVWGQHEQAKTDPRWRYGDPERTAAAVQEVFYPLCPTAVEPYVNRWLAGSPLGQVDVVGVDEFTRGEDLAGYRLLVYGGWNTMTPPVFQLLQRYVEQGGTLVLAVPHLSGRADREAVAYTPRDLPNGGELSELIDVRIVGRSDVSGRLLAEIEISPNPTRDSVEVVERVEGKPTWIRQKRGKGAVELFLDWEYPGKASLRTDFQRRVRRVAQRFVGPVVLEAEPEQRSCFSWAVYGTRVYVLNVDCVHAHACVVRTPGGSRRLEIPPAEMRTVDF